MVAVKAGRGGKRKGAGRKSLYGEPTELVRLPKSLASWIKEHLDLIRKIKDDHEN